MLPRLVLSLFLGTIAFPAFCGEISCPDGTRSKGEPYPSGREAYCARIGPNGEEIKHGPSVYWHENGQKASEYQYVDGEKHGTFSRWYESGQLRQTGEWSNGDQTGVWIEYHENGQKKEEKPWVDGWPEGTVTSWHDNGALEVRGEMRHGKQVGYWQFYDRNGKKTVLVHFALNGQVIDRWTYR